MLDRYNILSEDPWAAQNPSIYLDTLATKPDPAFR
jgi:hypothetical protein